MLCKILTSLFSPSLPKIREDMAWEDRTVEDEAAAEDERRQRRRS